MSRPVSGAAFVFLLAWPVYPLPAAWIPFLSGRVNDLAEILSPETSRDLERVLRSHEDFISNQVAALTIASLEGVESYALGVEKLVKEVLHDR